MQNIHFKVAANNAFRRFSLSDVTLASLKTQVASIFGVNDLNGWSIKYKDEENQLVTIASDEDLLFAVQLHGGKVLHLVIAFSPETQGNSSSRHEFKRHENHKARLAVRLNHKQERMREKLASLNPQENSHSKGKASKLEAKIASISMELESLKLNDNSGNASVELATGSSTEQGAKHTDRKFEVKCNRVSCLVRKQEHVQQKLAKIEHSDKPKKQEKVAKLKEKLAAITSKLEGMELEATTSTPTPLGLKGEPVTADPSNGIPKSETDANKQLVTDVKSKFFVMKRELHQDKMQVISLVKTLKALRILSKHGVAAGISLDSEKLAQTEVSLGIARDQLAAKKLVIQQQKDLLVLMKSQLGLGRCKKDWKKRGKKEDKKEKKEKKERKDKETKEGKVAKSEKWREEKKLRGERRARHGHKGRRCNKHSDMELSVGSDNAEKME